MSLRSKGLNNQTLLNEILIQDRTLVLNSNFLTFSNLSSVKLSLMSIYFMRILYKVIRHTEQRVRDETKTRENY